jgi:alpha-ketoglutarate-dependent taurine dioxygenase
MSLKAHTDSGYFRNTAGLELFHVIQRPNEGGNSLLLDGFYCAQLLKREHPEDYEFLKRVKVQIQFLKKGQYDFKTFETIIKEDELDNELYQIRYLFNQIIQIDILLIYYWYD